VYGSTSVGSTSYLDTCVYLGQRCVFSPADFVIWRRDGAAFAAWDFDGGFNVVNVAPHSCVEVPPEVASGVRGLRWTPDGERLLWTTEDFGGEGETLWAAGPSAESPVALATGGFLAFRVTPDGHRVYVMRTSSQDFGATTSLSWLDLTTATPVERLLSTNQGGILAGNRRVLILDHWNTQDSTGELVLLEPVTGARTSLARAVTGMVVGGDVDAGGTNLAYVVRTRAASARDGLWLATLPDDG
jgi:hypothetical protein